jgi:hypothetical protein
MERLWEREDYLTVRNIKKASLFPIHSVHTSSLVASWLRLAAVNRGGCPWPRNKKAAPAGTAFQDGWTGLLLDFFGLNRLQNFDLSRPKLGLLGHLYLEDAVFMFRLDLVLVDVAGQGK